MSSNRLIVAAVVCGMGLVLSLGLGPIDPPPGPVSPTGKTLQQIHDRIGEVGAASACDCGPWLSTTTPNVLDTPVELVAGSGLIHAVIIPDAHGIKILSGVGVNEILDLAIPSPGGPSRKPEKYVLNIRYENGLSVKRVPVGGFDSSRCTILYRPDSL